jgi:RimJ/RimL family protein N-acetyltransferase/8-oxo-dGTP pyrophosphatase MutT (NUDIX family)
VTDQASQLPELTDGVVTLRPFEPVDIDSHVAGADHESRLQFAIHHDGATVGTAQAQPDGDVASLSWMLYAGHRGHGYASRAVRLLVAYAFEQLHVRRVEAKVDPRNAAAQRVATRSGLHREGVQRLEPGMADPDDATGMVVYARLASDLPTTEPEGFRALLNSFLPRKRAISQLLVRDGQGRVLICRLTYKRDWDLPGGVVEVGESPQLAAAREVQEELALDLEAGRLLLTDWLPPWSGWDDAVCLVFDGGEHDPAITDRIRKEPREIRDAEFATVEEVRERCADFTARRIESALANLGAGGGPVYVESGRPT